MPSSLAESDGVAWPSGPSSAGPVISPAPHEDRRPPGSAARADLPGLAEQVMNEVDIGEIIRESSSTMATETVDTLRVQGMRADRLLGRTVDRVLGRREERQTGPGLVGGAEGATRP
jgi:hypothetical protein